MRATSFYFAMILVLMGSLTTMAQSVDTIIADKHFPVAPIPALSAGESSSVFVAGSIKLKQSAPSVKLRESAIMKWSYPASEAYFLGAVVGDMKTTYDFMHHPRQVQYTISCTNYRKVFPNSPCSLSGEDFVVGWNINPSDRFEGGWARIFGQDNPAAVIAANSIRGAAIVVAGRLLTRHGGKWKKIAVIAVNVYFGSGHLDAALSNVRYLDRIERHFVIPGAYNVRWFDR